MLGGLGVTSVVYASPALKVLTSWRVMSIGMLMVKSLIGNVLSLILALSVRVTGYCGIAVSFSRGFDPLS